MVHFPFKINQLRGFKLGSKHKFLRISNRPALIDGLSLNRTSLHQLKFGRKTKHKVRTIINVENWSRFILLDSQTDIHCGKMQQYQAANIYPGYREVMLAVGTDVFSGICGTVSWQVGWTSGHKTTILVSECIFFSLILSCVILLIVLCENFPLIEFSLQIQI